MKKIKLISLGLMLTMLGTGCNLSLDIPNNDQHNEESDQKKDTDSTTDDEDTAATESDDKDAEDKDASSDSSEVDDDSANDASSEELSSAELSELQELFNTATYNHFFDTAFESPEQINWTDVFLIGAGISEDCDCHTEEWENVNEACGGFPDYGKTIKFNPDDVKEFVENCSGLEFSDSMIPSSWFYSEEYDAYYEQLGDYGIDELTCVSGSKKGNEYTLRLECNKTYKPTPARQIVFTKEGDNLLFRSNTFLWEEIVDSKIYNIDTSQWGNALAYTVTEDTSTIIIAKNGDDVFNLEPFLVNADKTRCYFASITDVVFYDFNGDNFTDMLIQGEASLGTALYYGIGTKNYFDISYAGSTVTFALDGDVNIDNAFDYMLKYTDDGEYDDYNHAYAQCAFIESLDSFASSYGLQDVNNDNVPELIVSIEVDWGYDVTIYTFDDGCIKTIVDSYCGKDATGPIDGLDGINYEDLDFTMDYDQLIDKLEV